MPPKRSPSSKRVASPKRAASPKRSPPKSKKHTASDGLTEGTSALTLKDVMLQASKEVTSVVVADVPAQTSVFVLEVTDMCNGGQRALVALGDPSKGHAGGWVTSVSPKGKAYLQGGACFVRPNPVAPEEDTTAELASRLEEAAMA
mmetsp:Transcript_4624/g.12316  ORF Transcript_4624/g.12316 Transcript_4624/m.12316 type:complete len:146 (+) Transcript_4624:59-496(+)